MGIRVQKRLRNEKGDGRWVRSLGTSSLYILRLEYSQDANGDVFTMEWYLRDIPTSFVIGISIHVPVPDRRHVHVLARPQYPYCVQTHSERGGQSYLPHSLATLPGPGPRFTVLIPG